MTITIRIKDMINNSNIPAKLIRSTIAQFGDFESFKEVAEDVTKYGINGGFGGFVYYKDTVDFYRRNKKEIIGLATGQADELGMDVLKMIKGFGCMKGYTTNEIFSALSKYNEEYTQIYNCLAWYAGEEVSRLYCDLKENK